MHVDRSNESNVAAVGRPDDGFEVISRLTKNFAGILAVGIHLPDFFTAIFAAEEDNPGAIRRDGAVVAIVRELERRAAEDGSVPEAGFFRRGLPARHKNMIAIREPVHGTRWKRVRQNDGMSFPAAHYAEKETGAVGKSQV